MSFPKWFMTIVIVTAVAAAVYLIYKNPKVVSNSFPKQCEERLLPKADLGSTCPTPSKLMRVGDQWICSCRSEVDTMSGIKP